MRRFGSVILGIPAWSYTCSCGRCLRWTAVFPVSPKWWPKVANHPWLRRFVMVNYELPTDAATVVTGPDLVMPQPKRFSCPMMGWIRLSTMQCWCRNTIDIARSTVIIRVVRPPMLKCIKQEFMIAFVNAEEATAQSAWKKEKYFSAKCHRSHGCCIKTMLCGPMKPVGLEHATIRGLVMANSNPLAWKPASLWYASVASANRSSCSWSTFSRGEQKRVFQMIPGSWKCWVCPLCHDFICDSPKSSWTDLPF